MSTSGPADPIRPPDPPWSPYPVQDWRAPDAPPPPPSDVSPDWAPPRDRRPRWLPYAVVALVCVLIAGGFFVADRVGDREGAGAAREFVPADGAVQYLMRQAPGVADVPYVTESGRFDGAEMVTSLDFTFGTQVLGAAGLDLDALAGVPFWRTTTTQIGTPESSQQLTRVYQVDGPVLLLGESGPGVARIFSPGLVELPADVAPGAAWTSAGSAGPMTTYRASYRAEAAERGCLRVLGTLDLVEKNGRPRSRETVEGAGARTRASPATRCEPGTGR